MRKQGIAVLIALLGCSAREGGGDGAAPGTGTGPGSGASDGIDSSTSAGASTAEASTAVADSTGDALAPCNGSVALCDRPLDRVVFPGTHNSVAATESGFSAISANQRHPILRQLQDGIRVLLLDVTYDGDETALCHGPCSLGARSHVEVLAELSQFLDDNPREVLAIIYEDTATTADIAADYEAVGLVERTYVHSGGQWPTLGAMIEADTRLLVTAENGGPPPAWLHHVWDHAWDTPYTFTSVDAFDCTLNRGEPDHALVLVNHWISSEAGLPQASAAAEANAATVLEARVAQCMREAGRGPTFLAVDFYDEGDLLAVVDALNAAPQ